MINIAIKKENGKNLKKPGSKQPRILEAERNDWYNGVKQSKMRGLQITEINNYAYTLGGEQTNLELDLPIKNALIHS